MYKFHNPDFPHKKWDDIVLGIDGAEGWVSDNLKPDKRVIFFLGAWGYRDALSCVNVSKTRPEWDMRIKLHSGFLSLADRAWDAILPELETDKSIVFAGHSMGGALACMIAWRAHVQLGIWPTVELYGAVPLVGNGAFKHLFTALFPILQNHIAGLDIVPRLNWLGWFLGYRKPWANVHFEVESELKWWERLFADHEPEIYRRVIE